MLARCAAACAANYRHFIPLHTFILLSLLMKCLMTQLERNKNARPTRALRCVVRNGPQ